MVSGLASDLKVGRLAAYEPPADSDAIRARIAGLLCAADGHAKNFSLFLRSGGRYQLTPLYDVLSAYPVLGEGPGRLSPLKARMAMAIRSKNARWKMGEILRRYWQGFFNQEQKVHTPRARAGASVRLCTKRNFLGETEDLERNLRHPPTEAVRPDVR